MEAEVNYRNGGRYAHELLYPFSEHFRQHEALGQGF